VQDIIKSIGSTNVLQGEDDFEEGYALIHLPKLLLTVTRSSTLLSRSSSRRSALKARKSFQQNASPATSMAQTAKTIQVIKRNRKQRHAKLREMTKDEETGQEFRRISRAEITCPVCLMAVSGDEDVQHAHVDACLANEARRMDDQRLQEEQRLSLRQEEEEDVWDDQEGALGHVGNVQGNIFFPAFLQDHQLMI
jgi:hypothetical protein